MIFTANLMLLVRFMHFMHFWCILLAYTTTSLSIHYESSRAYREKRARGKMLATTKFKKGPVGEHDSGTRVVDLATIFGMLQYSLYNFDRLRGYKTTY